MRRLSFRLLRWGISARQPPSFNVPLLVTLGECQLLHVAVQKQNGAPTSAMGRGLLRALDLEVASTCQLRAQSPDCCFRLERGRNEQN